MIEIREATIEDQPGVFNLLKQLMSGANEESAINQQSGVNTYRQMLKGETGTVFVAIEDGNMLGLVTLSYPVAIRCGGAYSSIEEFIVTEQARGKGVGGALLEAAIARATERGCYELLVSRPSELGYPVYLRHGWQDAGKALLMNLPRVSA